MKKMNFAAALMALGMAGVCQADFNSITCANEYQGVQSLNLVKRADGSGAYDLTIARPHTGPAENFGTNLDCRNQPASGAGTFVSLVNCIGRDNGSAQRVVVGHSANVNWVDRDDSGALVPTATGTEVEFVITRPGQLFPFLVLTFTPDQCKQL